MFLSIFLKKTIPTARIRGWWKAGLLEHAFQKGGHPQIVELERGKAAITSGLRGKQKGWLSRAPRGWETRCGNGAGKLRVFLAATPGFSEK